MKQVVFAIALLAMASLTGCLNTDDTSVDNEMLDPVGLVEIPENSSIFMDSVGEAGVWNCEEARESPDSCQYVLFEEDKFVTIDDSESFYLQYQDSDGIQNAIEFSGWVNKTGNLVTIEPLLYPDRGPKITEDSSRIFLNYRYINSPVSSGCIQESCIITFFGHNGLMYTANFELQQGGTNSWQYEEDSEDPNDKNNYYYHAVYGYNFPTFDLPFEPYAFSIGKHSVDLDYAYNHEDSEYFQYQEIRLKQKVYRIF